MEEKKLDAPALSGQETLTPPQAEAQLSALIQQLSRQMEESAQAEAARKEALDTREEELQKREMAAKTREEMEKRGLPAQLAEGLIFENAEAMEMGVEALEECFRAAVQQGVEARMLTDAPKTTPLQPLSEMSDEDYYAAVYSRHE